jgi:hypothetical protein
MLSKPHFLMLLLAFLVHQTLQTCEFGDVPLAVLYPTISEDAIVGNIYNNYTEGKVIGTKAKVDCSGKRLMVCWKI